MSSSHQSLVQFENIFYPTVLIGLLSALATAYCLSGRSRQQPPGPWVLLPGIGHLLSFSNNPVARLRSLRQQYGDVFKVYMGTMPVVFINGFEVVNAVLHDRGTEFAHRPPSFIAEKLASNKGLLNTSGHVWNEQKKNIARTLRSLAASGGLLERYLESTVKDLTDHLQSMLQNGTGGQVDVTPVLRRSVFSFAFSMAYGRQLDLDSPLLISYTDTLDQFLRCLNMAVMTTFIPYIHMLPNDPVGYRKCKQLAVTLEMDFVWPELKRIMQASKDSQTTCETKVSETVTPPVLCYAGGYIEEMNEKRRNNISTELSEEHLSKTVSDVVVGSFDSITTTILWFLIYMTHYPEVQRKCRQEIHKFLGDAGFEASNVDRSQLVYTQATIMEVQRSANIVPMPPCHASDKDTYINGYFIPKNTAIITNMDSLMMGPEVGDDPHEFRPERFLTADGKPFYPRWFLPFLTGKRMCPGVIVAKKELLGFVVGLLSKFQFSAPLVDGKEVPLSLDGAYGLTKTPLPFKMCVQSV